MFTNSKEIAEYILLHHLFFDVEVDNHKSEPEFEVYINKLQESVQAAVDELGIGFFTEDITELFTDDEGQAFFDICDKYPVLWKIPNTLSEIFETLTL